MPLSIIQTWTYEEKRMKKSLTGKHNSDRSEDKETKKDLEIIKQPKTKNQRAELTWWNVYACVLLLCHIHIDGDFSLRQAQLHPAIRQGGEHQKAVGIPRPERQTDWQGVAVSLTRQPQEGCGVEENWGGVGFGAGKRQVTLQWKKETDKEIYGVDST